MASLKTALGSVKLSALNRERLIEFGRKRAKEGAGPPTLAIDLSFIRTIITHAAAVHGIEVSGEEARLARVALSHLNLVGRGKARDRRPTQDELSAIHTDGTDRQVCRGNDIAPGRDLQTRVAAG